MEIILRRNDMRLLASGRKITALLLSFVVLQYQTPNLFAAVWGTGTGTDNRVFDSWGNLKSETRITNEHRDTVTDGGALVSSDDNTTTATSIGNGAGQNGSVSIGQVSADNGRTYDLTGRIVNTSQSVNTVAFTPFAGMNDGGTGTLTGTSLNPNGIEASTVIGSSVFALIDGQNKATSSIQGTNFVHDNQDGTFSTQVSYNSQGINYHPATGNIIGGIAVSTNETATLNAAGQVNPATGATFAVTTAPIIPVGGSYNTGSGTVTSYTGPNVPLQNLPTLLSLMGRV
jgi:hypothetical protein